MHKDGVGDVFQTFYASSQACEKVFDKCSVYRNI